MRRVLLPVVVATLAAPAFAQSPAAPHKEKKEETRLVKAKTPPLRAVDLVAAFGDAYGFLADLGVRVDRARQYAEPTALAAAAVELGLAERGAGRRAKEVTAAGLLDEAWELAKAQRSAEATAIVARAFEQLGDVGKAKAAGDEAAALKAARERLATRAPGDLLGFVRVYNHSSYTLRIHVWGAYMGSVSPGAVGATPVAEGQDRCAPLRAVSAAGNASASTRACFEYRSQTINWHVR